MIRLAHLTAPLRGETCNGDAVYTHVHAETGRVLICVIDGLGHGPNAALAADRALACLAREVSPRSALDVMMRLHEDLKGSRGAAATVCLFQGTSLSACGVGNVSLRAHGTSVPFVLTPGVVGARISNLRATTVSLKCGDRILLHTDGVSSRFSLQETAQLETEAACAALFEAHRKTNDDATLLVADVTE